VITDFKSYKIPNKSILALLVLFIPYWVFLPEQVSWSNFLIFAIILTIGFFLSIIGILGAGDAKLLAVISLWLGYEHTFQLISTMAILGGIIGIAYVSYRRWCTMGEVSIMKTMLMPIPYGIAIGVSAIHIFMLEVIT
jgi:prepilin peptidase CpaA